MFPIWHSIWQKKNNVFELMTNYRHNLGDKICADSLLWPFKMIGARSIWNKTKFHPGVRRSKGERLAHRFNFLLSPLFFHTALLFLLNCRYEVFHRQSKTAFSNQRTFSDTFGNSINARVSRFRWVVSRVVRARATFLCDRVRKGVGCQIVCFRLDFRHRFLFRLVLVADVFVYHIRWNSNANCILFVIDN